MGSVVVFHTEPCWLNGEIQMNKRRIALVTGGSRGIGKAIVENLSREFDIYYTYNKINSSLLETDHIQPMRADSNSYEEINRVVEQILQIGNISVLVNNAGIVKDKTCRKMGKNEWDDVISINLNSAFYFTKACIESMIDSGWGRIINISSIIGLSGGFGQSNYSAAKAGLIGFTKSLALELALKQITVNAIAPGYVETDMTREIPDTYKAKIIKSIPMQRFGTVSEVASLVRYLTSHDSSYITGQVFEINGGL